MASLSNTDATHPPRSNPPLRSSSAPPSPCITPSTVTIVMVVSFMGSSLLSWWSFSFDRTGARISSVERGSVLPMTDSHTRRISSRGPVRPTHLVGAAGASAGAEGGQAVVRCRDGAGVGPDQLGEPVRDAVEPFPIPGLDHVEDVATVHEEQRRHDSHSVRVRRRIRGRVPHGSEPRPVGVGEPPKLVLPVLPHAGDPARIRLL